MVLMDQSGAVKQILDKRNDRNVIVIIYEIEIKRLFKLRWGFPPPLSSVLYVFIVAIGFPSLG